MKRICLPMAVLLMAALMGNATPISVDQAKLAVGNFVRRSPKPLGTPAAGSVVRAETEEADGEDLFHVVYLSDGGYVVTSADKDISPIMVIGDGNDFIATDENPIYSLLKNDLKGRKKALGKASTATSGAAAQARVSSATASKSAAAQAWDELLETPKAQQQKLGTLPTSPVASPSDVRVAPLTETKWDQSTWGGSSHPTTINIFNKYTPYNAACGCVATAAAQVMYCWKHPQSSPTRKCQYTYASGNRITPYTENCSGVTYNWDSMPPSYEDVKSPTTKQIEAIAALTSDVGRSFYMKYTGNGSGTGVSIAAYYLVNDFKYASACAYSATAECGYALSDDYSNAIFSNLDAQQPVLFGISGTAGGHCVVGDGYGYQNDWRYVHINCGWSGKGNSWYCMPDGRKMGNYDFTLLCEMAFNINATEKGDIVSGRVLNADGNAVQNATVTMTKDGETLTTKSNGTGIYFFRVAEAGKYLLSANNDGAASKEASVEMAKITPLGGVYYTVSTANNVYSKNEQTISGREPYYVGNKWGVDLYLQNQEEEKIEEQGPTATPVFSPAGGEFETSVNVTISCGTSGATIRYTTDGSEPTSTSTKYTSAITLTASTTLKAKAYGDKTLASDTAVAVFTKKVTPPTKLPTPTISPEASKFVGSCTVTLACSDAKATIYYTTDGSVPTTSSTKYSKAFTVTKSGDFTVSAIAYRSGNYTVSDVATKTYTVTAKTKVAAPSVSPAAGTFALNTTVTISGGTSSSTIHYTTDGTTPNSSSPVYSTPLFISKTTTVRAIAIPSDTTRYLSSDPIVAKYTIDSSKTINTALNNSKLKFTTSSNSSSAHVAYVEGDDAALYTRDGSAALRLVIDSNTPSDNVSLSTVLTGPGVLTFWIQGDLTRTVSGNKTTTSYSDTMSYYLDGARKSTTSIGSADNHWTQQMVIVPEGAHTFTWKCGYNSYKKRGRGVLDCVEWLTGSDLPNVSIAFNVNGGSGTPSFVSTNGAFGSTVKLASVGTMTMPGCHFMGWNTKSDGTGKWLSAGASYSIIQRESFVLYAMWQELVPVYAEVPYDATNVVFEIPKEYGTSWGVSEFRPAEWVKPSYTLRSVGSGVHITVTVGLGGGCYNLSAADRFTLELRFTGINDSALPRTFEFPIYPDKYRRAPVFTVIQLPDRETDKLAGISLSGSSVANADIGTKLICTANLRNGKRNVVSDGVNWSMAAADASVATVSASGEVKSKVRLKAPRTVTVCAAYTDAGGYSATAEREITLTPNVGLADALDATDFIWTTDTGANAWTGQSSVSGGTGSSAMAGSAFLGTPRMTTTVDGPGYVCCKCRVTGLTGGGTIWAIIDEGTANESKHFCAMYLADAPSNWIAQRIKVEGSGTHTITFVYSADGQSSDTPDDNAYIDGFSYEVDTTIPYYVKFVSNGTTLRTIECYWGSVFALPKSVLSNGSKRFAGWKCSNGKRYDDGVLVYNLASPGSTVTMTAIWE